MLVINAKGIIYDVPEQDLKQHAVPRWIDKKTEVAKLFTALTKVLKESKEGLKGDVEGQGCCNRFANWCPPGGGNQ
jgi:hypothetical protein